MPIFGHYVRGNYKKFIAQIAPVIAEAGDAEEIEVFIPKEAKFDLDKSDVGQLIDHPDVKGFWEITETRREVEEKMDSGGISISGGSFAVLRRVHGDPFPDEILEGNQSRALQTYDSASSQARLASPMELLVRGARGISSDGRYCIVDDFYWTVVENSKRTNDERKNPMGRKLGDPVLMVVYRDEEEATHTSEPIRERKKPLSKFLEDFELIPVSQEELKRLVSNAEKGEIPEDLIPPEEESVSESRALVSTSNPQFLKTIQNQLELRRSKAEVMRRGMQRMVEQEKNRLYAVMKQMYAAVEVFKKKLKKIYKLITTLEIYLGVHEEIYQIAEGKDPDEGVPVSLRQLVLYMDEEFGDITDGGLDFERLEDFDEWLVTDRRFERLLSEQRGVVALKVRRREKEYSEQDNHLHKWKHDLNRATYFLIRNGDNLYRIFTPHVQIGTTMFPLRKDFRELVERMQKVEQMEQEIIDGKRNTDYRFEDEKEKVEDKLFSLQKSVLLLQGLLTRTEVFQGLPPTLNLMKAETYGDSVQFIYDAEASLPSGRLPYRKWQKLLNSSLQKGSRVLISMRTEGRYVSPKDYKDRFTLSNLSRDGSVPSLPKEGVYRLSEYVQKWKERVEVELPWDQCSEDDQNQWKNSHRKYSHEEEDWVSPPPPATLKVNVRDKTKKDRWGQHPYLYEEKEKRHLTVTYNPKDEVYGSWGDYDPHTRKTNVGFRILPEDSFILNYDQLTLEDVEFYIDCRLERENYLNTLPLLYRVREQLKKEMAWEESFVQHFANTLRNELGDVVPAEADVPGVVREAVLWYKEERVKFKRSITERDADALRQIELRSRQLLRERYKLKKVVDAGTDTRQQVLLWHHEESGRSWVVTGVWKHEAVEDMLTQSVISLSRSMRQKVTKSRINREMQVTKVPELVQLANDNMFCTTEVPKPSK